MSTFLIPTKEGLFSPMSAGAFLASLEQRVLPKASSPFQNEWDFLCRAVWTRDEVRGLIRPFPAEREYLRYVVEVRKQHPIFAIDKSRRMYMTWLFCALYLYDTLTEPHHANYIGSRKLESSCELLGRIQLIYESMPVGVWPGKPQIVTHAGFSGKGYRRIDCPTTDSFVEAVAQGKDQLRQVTASNIFLDEFAFWNLAEESWGALVPTTEGGGHVDIVSTPELGSFMQTLIFE